MTQDPVHRGGQRTQDMFVIRRARLRDATAIAGFNRAMALETERRILIPGIVEAGVRRLLDTPALGFYVVAERAGEVVACLMVTHEWSESLREGAKREIPKLANVEKFRAWLPRTKSRACLSSKRA